MNSEKKNQIKRILKNILFVLYKSLEMSFRFVLEPHKRAEAYYARYPNQTAMAY